MKRARVAAGGIAFALFALLFVSVCCTAPPPIADGLRIAPPQGTGRFIIYGDSRPAARLEFLIRPTDFEKERQQIFARLAEEKPDFIVHTGDLVQRGSSEGSWEQWDRDAAPLRKAGIPIYPALGNHEYAGGADDALPRFRRRFPDLNDSNWYSLRAGRLLLVVLDSNFDSLSRPAAKRQDEWLDQALSAADADAAVEAVFVVAHASPYTNSLIHAPDVESQKRFVARFWKSPKARAYFSGHVHSYERFLIDGIQFVVTGGGGAPTTGVNVDLKKFRDEYRGPENRPFHYCLIRMEPRRISVDVMMLRDDGTWYRGDGFTIE